MIYHDPGNAKRAEISKTGAAGRYMYLFHRQLVNRGSFRKSYETRSEANILA